MRGVREILFGLVLVTAGMVGIWYLLDEVLAVLLGFIPLVVLFFGVFFLMIGANTLRTRSAEPAVWGAESGDDKRE